MKKLALTSIFLAACAAKNTSASLDASAEVGTDSGLACFPCKGYWICGADVGRIDLDVANDGCYLNGLPGRNLLAPDGTITAGGAVVGNARGSGARVYVSYPDGGTWLICAGGGGC